MKSKIETLESKVDIMRDHWEHTQFRWYQIAIEKKDTGMKNILKQVARAPTSLREFILQNYIRQCKKKYAVAFMEWRLYFSKARANNNDSTQMEDSDVQEIIDDRLEYLLSEF